MTDISGTFRLDLTINLALMLGTAAFFLVFPSVFAGWPPRHFSDVVALVIAGEVYGLVNALWSRTQGERAGLLGRRMLAGFYGSLIAGVIILLATHTVQVLVLSEPERSTDFLAVRLLLFGPPAGALASVLVVWLYDRRQV